jgi:hypothetical protein
MVGVPSYLHVDRNGDLQMKDVPPAVQRLLAATDQAACIFLVSNNPLLSG